MLCYVALSLASDATTITQAIGLTAARAGCMKPEVDASHLQQPLTQDYWGRLLIAVERLASMRNKTVRMRDSDEALLPLH